MMPQSTVSLRLAGMDGFIPAEHPSSQPTGTKPTPQQIPKRQQIWGLLPKNLPWNWGKCRCGTALRGKSVLPAQRWHRVPFQGDVGGISVQIEASQSYRSSQKKDTGARSQLTFHLFN